MSSIFFKDRFGNSTLKTKIFNMGILIFVILGIILYSFNKIGYSFRWADTLFTYYPKFIYGFFMTINLSFFSLLMSLIIGTIIAIGSISNFLPYYYFSKGYVEIIRGTPLIVQIYIFFYVIGTALNLENRYISGIMIMGVFSGAYVAEIIRAGIESIGKTQLDSAKTLGFTTYQKYRYIIFPQLIKRIMPSLAGQVASLIKDSSLLSIIAVNEFTKNIQEVDSLTFAPIENYFILAIGYLLLTFPISVLSKKLERKYSYET
ncbi:MAG: amino acid ABC transporter permease [Fusobacteriaceae bacterium]